MVPNGPWKYFEIDRFSHHFVVKKMSPRGQQVAEAFARNYIQYGIVKVGRVFKRAPIKVFAAKITSRNEIRFHWAQWDEFQRHLGNSGVRKEDYILQEFGHHEIAPLDRYVKSTFTPRDYQGPVIDYMVDEEPSPKKLVQLQAGKGKSIMSMFAASRINSRTLIFLKPQFIKKWVDDLHEKMDLEKDDIAVIQGSASLMTVIDEALNDELKAKFIIVSNKTFQNWISSYEQKGDKLLDEGYGCSPHELMHVCKVGLRVIDEVHMDFHLNFKIDLYTHVKNAISLSATLISDDKFVSRMQYIAYPEFMRFAGLEFDKYVHSHSLHYRVAEPEKMQTTERGSNNYSHNAYEKNFYRSKKLMQDYLKLIGDQVEEHYIKRRKDGERCLVYGASIQFCTTLAEYLKKRFPERDVRRYVENDVYDNLMEAELCVSTVGSAGTGHDIPGLITVILTPSIRSSASNIQGFGRLRNLEGKVMIFVYFTCDDIPKHVEYYESKELLLAGMALTRQEVFINQVLG